MVQSKEERKAKQKENALKRKERRKNDPEYDAKIKALTKASNKRKWKRIKAKRESDSEYNKKYLEQMSVRDARHKAKVREERKINPELDAKIKEQERVRSINKRAKKPEKYRTYAREYAREYRNNDEYRAKSRETRAFRLKTDKEYAKKIKVRMRTGNYKKEILDYFKHKCQKCGTTENLQLHHTSYDLKPYKNHEEMIKNLFDISILLCHDCHIKTHKK